MRRSGPPKRRKPIARESAKRRSQRQARQKVTTETRARFGVCQMLRHSTKCFGRLETHELVGGSRRHATHLEKDVCITLCAAHNTWVEAHAIEAYRLGMKIKGWVYDKEPEEALAEAKRLRGKLWMSSSFEGEDPYWFFDPYWLGAQST